MQRKGVSRMIIPKEILIDDYLGATDFYGNQLEKEQLIYIKEKIEEVLTSEEGHLKKEGYVYFLKDVNNLIKIGCTNNVKNRIYSLKRNHGELKILKLIKCNKMIDLERYYHIIFKDNRVTGEWFDLKEDIVLDLKLGECEINNFGAMVVQ